MIKRTIPIAMLLGVILRSAAHDDSMWPNRLAGLTAGLTASKGVASSGDASCDVDDDSACSLLQLRRKADGKVKAMIASNRQHNHRHPTAALELITTYDHRIFAVHDALDIVNTVRHVDGTDAADRTTLVVAYVCALMVMCAFIIGMLYPMGLVVCFQVILYICCLALVKISMKFVYAYKFNFPKFITSLHLLVSTSAAFTVLLYRKSTHGKPIAVPTCEEFLCGVLPIAFTFGLSVGAENSALVFVSAAFSEVVAATNPVMSAFLTWLFGMGFNVKTLWPISVLVCGCIVSVSGELFFSTLGFALLLAAVFFRALKAVMQQRLLTGEAKEKFDPVTLMGWSCLCAFFQLFLYSLWSEGTAPWTFMKNTNDLAGLVLALFSSCMIACALNISALFVIKQLGAVGMQMLSQMKAILVVIGGIAILGETFTIRQKVGFGMALVGVYWYSVMKRRLDAEAREAAGAKVGH